MKKLLVVVLLTGVLVTGCGKGSTRIPEQSTVQSEVVETSSMIVSEVQSVEDDYAPTISKVSTNIAEAELLKEQTRAQQKESLLEIIQNEELSEEVKKDAVNSMRALTETIQKESDAQMLLEAKGFTNILVSINGDSVDVMVEAENLTDAQIAQIIEIIHRKTDISSENIVITMTESE